MLVKNTDVARGIVNGARGVVTRFESTGETRDTVPVPWNTVHDTNNYAANYLQSDTLTFHEDHKQLYVKAGSQYDTGGASIVSIANITGDDFPLVKFNSWCLILDNLIDWTLTNAVEVMLEFSLNQLQHHLILTTLHWHQCHTVDSPLVFHSLTSVLIENQKQWNHCWTELLWSSCCTLTTHVSDLYQSPLIFSYSWSLLF